MDVKSRIDQFLAELQKRMNAYDGDQKIHHSLLEVEFGRKFAKVSKLTYGSRSAYCFIDLSNGDLLKAASWKAPAKGARGNIFADDFGMSACQRYTLVYKNRKFPGFRI